MRSRRTGSPNTSGTTGNRTAINNRDAVTHQTTASTTAKTRAADTKAPSSITPITTENIVIYSGSTGPVEYNTGATATTTSSVRIARYSATTIATPPSPHDGSNRVQCTTYKSGTAAAAASTEPSGTRRDTSRIPPGTARPPNRVTGTAHAPPCPGGSYGIGICT
ncbi:MULTISPECIES: hypothetical protein [unclassified Serratia (in: enterobacteria)]|uniref:hypothetical protein n=1 Tax=unclassified Serratia (in: enterobacteria) TaxID=2647522 RepID=UPI003075F4B8